MQSARRRARSLALAGALVLGAAGCGGGGGGGGGAGGGAGGSERPDVAVLFVSGHALGGDPAYLRFDAAPELADDLEASGRTVVVAHYVDGETAVGDAGGYPDLVADLESLRDGWAAQGTRVVVVAHSHGGVWAHAALRAVPDAPVAALVDLDVSSLAWTLLHDPAAIGLDPRDAYDLGVTVAPPGLEDVPSEEDGTYDLEDVVLPNVVAALEVRSGDGLGGEWYDERWNCRTTGSTEGVWWHFSGAGHSEVHAAGGATMALVRAWLRERLAE